MHTVLPIWRLWASIPESFSVSLFWLGLQSLQFFYTYSYTGPFIKHFTCAMHGAKYFYINNSFMRAKLMADLKELDDFDCHWKTYVLGSSKISQTNPNGENRKFID